MRVLLTLDADRPRTSIPLSYNHAVASLIYGILGSASTQFASMLHETGYIAGGRRFKLFTFSRLSPVRSHVSGSALILDDSRVQLLISSPVTEFVETFVAGLFQCESFRIDRAEFHLLAAETIAAPDFTEEMSFLALSPITESVPEAGSRHPRFLSMDDSDALWSQIVGRNLVRKFTALHGHEPEDSRFEMQWDREYIREYAERGKRASALVTIVSGKEEIKVRGWLAPFAVSGCVDMVRLGYEAGFGARNSMGFGLTERTV